MSSRRTHNKTRLGCGQCKKRRVKCDGKHPTCASCEKRGLDCSFLQLLPSSRLLATSETTSSQLTTVRKTSNYVRDSTSPSSSSVSTTSRSASPLPPFSLTIGSSIIEIPRLQTHIKLHDVRQGFRESLGPSHQGLLDHYERMTCLTLATDGPAKAVWQTFVPQLAEEHKFIAHSILSVSSLHLARLHDAEIERTAMTRVAAEQMNRALKYYRAELNQITEENAAALFACATIIAVYLFRTSAMDLRDTIASIPAGILFPPPSVTDKLVDSVIRTFWALRGALSILQPAWDWLSQGEMSPVCVREWWPTYRIPANARAWEEDKRLSSLERLWMHPGRRYQSHFECLSAALNHLRETYALVSQLTDPTATYPQMSAPVEYAVDDTTVGMLRDRATMLVWATHISKEFISLVEQKNVEALVIVAHYAVLIGRVKNVWWMDGLGADMIRATGVALGPGNVHLIEWPAQVVGVELGTERNFDLTVSDILREASIVVT